MKKAEQQKLSEREIFPSNILYSSPPEVESLSAWVREMQNKQRSNSSANQPDSRNSYYAARSVD
jgi:hypothetical protein